MEIDNTHKNKVIELAMGGCWHDLERVTILSEPDMPSHIECKICEEEEVKNLNYFNPDYWDGMGRIISFLQLNELEQSFIGKMPSPIITPKDIKVPLLIADVFYIFVKENKNLEPFASNDRLMKELKKKEVSSG